MKTPKKYHISSKASIWSTWQGFGSSMVWENCQPMMDPWDESGIFTYMKKHKNHPNVGKTIYQSHGSYGKEKDALFFRPEKMTHRHHQMFAYMKGEGLVEKTLEKKHMPIECRYVLRSWCLTFLYTKNAWDFWKLGKSSLGKADLIIFHSHLCHCSFD